MVFKCGGAYTIYSSSLEHKYSLYVSPSHLLSANVSLTCSSLLEHLGLDHRVGAGVGVGTVTVRGEPSRAPTSPSPRVKRSTGVDDLPNLVYPYTTVALEAVNRRDRNETQ